ncbi:extracellular solute-binding protein [Paenibacillus periandrae]|uniref:extracellular solute-binding protein n=1 Tax=Paenibacillus periandrae TaxID=1761741 RepID=UPI0030845CCC
MDANGGEWRKQFTSMLDTGKYGSQTYGVTISGVFPLIYANQDLLDKAGVKIPDNWNWEQFLDTLKQIKEKTGVYPFGAANDQAIILPREGLQSIGEAQNKLDELSKLQIPIADPMFTKMLENLKKLGIRILWWKRAYKSLSFTHPTLLSSFKFRATQIPGIIIGVSLFRSQLERLPGPAHRRLRPKCFNIPSGVAGYD